ncbi:MAG: mycothiol system anti-sigma-R factor [Actinomycetota bacterium]|nr:mycothiol system anti-sigma-R factor [Actinomycetota bacterium]
MGDHYGEQSATEAGSGAHGSGCREALDVLYHYLDGELDEERRAVIHYHLERCSPCLEAFDFEAELKLVVAQRCRESVPESLRDRVAAAIAQASVAPSGDPTNRA